MNFEAMVWMALMIIFLVVEAACPIHLVSIWFAVGSLIAGIAAWLLWPLWLQIALFLVISGALLALAMEDPSPRRQREILAAAQDRENPRWCWLMARAEMALGEYAKALGHLKGCVEGREVWQAREVCCRELGDFKGAYEAACKLR